MLWLWLSTFMHYPIEHVRLHGHEIPLEIFRC